MMMKMLSAEICCPCKKSEDFLEITKLLFNHGAEVMPKIVSENEVASNEAAEWVDEEDDTLQNPLDYICQVSFKKC
jgi:hypothetical protein